MTEIEKKALALVNEVVGSGSWTMTNLSHPYNRVLFQALCRAIEQHEAYKQEVSEAVRVLDEFITGSEDYKRGSRTDIVRLADGRSVEFACFIIPKPVDPLVEALNDMKDGRAGPTTESYAACLRAALAARGGRIVFDQPEGGE